MAVPPPRPHRCCWCNGSAKCLRCACVRGDTPCCTVSLESLGTAVTPGHVVLRIRGYPYPAVLQPSRVSLPWYLLQRPLHHRQPPVLACPLSLLSSKPPFPPFVTCQRELETAGLGYSAAPYHQCWRTLPTSPAGPRSSCWPSACWLVQPPDAAYAGERC